MEVILFFLNNEWLSGVSKLNRFNNKGKESEYITPLPLSLQDAFRNWAFIVVETEYKREHTLCL